MPGKEIEGGGRKGGKEAEGGRDGEVHTYVYTQFTRYISRIGITIRIELHEDGGGVHSEYVGITNLRNCRHCGATAHENKAGLPGSQ